MVRMGGMQVPDSDASSLIGMNADSSLSGFRGSNPIDEYRNQNTSACHKRAGQSALKQQRTDDGRDGAYGKSGDQRNDVVN